MKIVYSAGGYSREFLRCARQESPGERFVLVDDAPGGDAVSYEQALLLIGSSPRRAIVGFADAALRRRKTEQLIRDGFSIDSVKAATAIIGDNVSLGEGFVISDYAIMTADAAIGKSFHCNIYSYVAHDCVIGDYVTLAPRVSINGRVTIEDDVYIGTGATILPGKKNAPRRIGKGAVIGAHALVTRDVEPGATVVGSPAKPLSR